MIKNGNFKETHKKKVNVQKPSTVMRSVGKEKKKKVDKDTIYAWILLVFFVFWTIAGVLGSIAFFRKDNSAAVVANADEIEPYTYGSYNLLSPYDSSGLLDIYNFTDSHYAQIQSFYEYSYSLSDTSIELSIDIGEPLMFGQNEVFAFLPLYNILDDIYPFFQADMYIYGYNLDYSDSIKACLINFDEGDYYLPDGMSQVIGNISTNDVWLGFVNTSSQKRTIPAGTFTLNNCYLSNINKRSNDSFVPSYEDYLLSIVEVGKNIGYDEGYDVGYEDGVQQGITESMNNIAWNGGLFSNATLTLRYSIYNQDDTGSIYIGKDVYIPNGTFTFDYYDYAFENATGSFSTPFEFYSYNFDFYTLGQNVYKKNINIRFLYTVTENNIDYFLANRAPTVEIVYEDGGNLRTYYAPLVYYSIQNVDLWEDLEFFKSKNAHVMTLDLSNLAADVPIKEVSFIYENHPVENSYVALTDNLFNHFIDSTALFSQAYDLGFSNGLKELNNIYPNELKAQYDSGFKAGKIVGFNEGVENANEYTFTGLLSAIVDVPIKAFTSLFDFEILGINMANFALSLLTMCAILAVIKLII